MLAPPLSLGPLWAVHISDGVLAPSWLIGGFALAALLALVSAYRVSEEEIPRIALLSAAFFIATLMHVRVGPTSVHLLLNGLVGVVLGRRATLAVLIGLGMQAALLGHGGFSTLGVNTCVMALPALLAGALFAILHRLPLPRRKKIAYLWIIGFLIGALAVLATLLLNAVVLLAGGVEDFHQTIQLVFLALLPLAPIEGVVVGFTVSFLARVKPEMLGIAAEGDPVPSRPPALPLVVLILLSAAGPAFAHRPDVQYTLLPDRQVEIEGWFDPSGEPMKGAKVQVFHADRSLLAEGNLNDKGKFVFRYSEAEPLEVIVSAGAGHRASLAISREQLGGTSAPVPERSAWGERIKDALLGVTFLLAFAAFLLSWRNGRKLKQLRA